jgi:chorismate mutase
MTKDLKKIRKQIDKIDKKLKKQLGKREKLIKKIKVIKKNTSLPVENKKREREILSKIKSPFIKKVFKEMIKISKEIQS